MNDDRLSGEIPLSELNKRWYSKWGLHRTRVWELVTQEEVIPYRRTPSRIYVREREADAYVHNFRRGRQREYNSGHSGQPERGAA